MPRRSTRASASSPISRCSVLALVALLACKDAPAVDPLDAATSPQAKAEPAPLANVTATSSATATGSAGNSGPPPATLRADRPLGADVPREATRETGAKDAGRDAKELSGYALSAIVRTGEGPPAPAAREVNAQAIEAARRKTEAHVSIEASATRARLAVSGAWAAAQGTEIRARVDRYGYVVVAPGQSEYRVAAPGALRALLGEGRFDVAPLGAADVVSAGEGARRLGARTRRVEVATRAAKATFEIATMRDAGEGGTLVCRVLLDLMSAPPQTPACTTDEVPLHAELRWTTRGALSFDVTSIAQRFDLPAQDLAAPPSSASFVAEAPRTPPAVMLLPKSDLASFRTAPVDVPAAPPRDARAPVAPEAGLVLVNASEQMRVAWIDGVPAVAVAPGARESLPSLLRGRYTLQWRTMLGDSWEAPETIAVPGISEVGAD